MDTNSHELILKKEVYQIVSCAIEIINDLGHGLHEKPYENALVIEFGIRDIPCDQQREFPVVYKDHVVSKFIPDLIAYNQIVVDTKVIEKITDHERGQMLNYLKITGCRVGVILNFKHRKLEWQRLAL
jgi:GxxExxY protein